MQLLMKYMENRDITTVQYFTSKTSTVPRKYRTYEV